MPPETQVADRAEEGVRAAADSERFPGGQQHLVVGCPAARFAAVADGVVRHRWVARGSSPSGERHSRVGAVARTLLTQGHRQAHEQRIDQPSHREHPQPPQDFAGHHISVPARVPTVVAHGTRTAHRIS
ncbi:hypothetical protein AB0D49_33490 [Streptomyces sp. NPDC048290]|uniref:hypothetical protein n=1 Tax=Streptomyces sp. NPDC048290 TaxID=3155811 RepID=UPI0034406B86